MVMIYRKGGASPVDVDATEARIEVVRGNASYVMERVRLRLGWRGCNPGEIIGVTSEEFPELFARGVVERYVEKGSVLEPVVDPATPPDDSGSVAEALDELEPESGITHFFKRPRGRLRKARD
jgi:hypothetical protein